MIPLWEKSVIWKTEIGWKIGVYRIEYDRDF